MDLLDRHVLEDQERLQQRDHLGGVWMAEDVYSVKMSISSLDSPSPPKTGGASSLTGTWARALRRKSCWRASRTNVVSVWR